MDDMDDNTFGNLRSEFLSNKHRNSTNPLDASWYESNMMPLLNAHYEQRGRGAERQRSREEQRGAEGKSRGAAEEQRGKRGRGAKRNSGDSSAETEVQECKSNFEKLMTSR